MMTRVVRYFGVSCCLLLPALFGCDKTPPGFPDLVPATIEVYDGDAPMDGILVGLVASKPIDSVICGGKTNSSGKAVMQTTLASYQKDGVPAGEYQVTLREQVVVQHTKTPAEYSALSTAEQKSYDEEHAKRHLAVERKISPILSDANQSPIMWTIDASDGNLRVDVSKYRK